MNKRTLTAGLTLVELLVAIAIFGIITLLVSQFFTSGTSISMASSSRAELQQEVLNAQQLMAANVKQAWYVYPAGSPVNMTTSALTQKPGGGNNWVVGADPILAVILLPEAPGGNYRFRAYYPVQRSTWVAGTANSSWRNPGADALNDASTWVLAEYRVNLAPAAVANIATALPTVTGGQANLLADYIAPTTVSAAPYTMFSYVGAASNRAVTIRTAVSQQVGSQTLRLPGRTGAYEITATANNLGKLPQ